MQTRALFVEEIIPAYEKMLDLLDNESTIGKGVLKSSTINICNLFNNLVDYIAKENVNYINDHWDSTNINEFRRALENNKHVIDGAELSGDFFGFIRDIANTSKHLEIGRLDAKVREISCVRECLSRIRFEDNDGYYYINANMVVVESTNQLDIPCEILIYFTFRMFTEILINSGILQSIPILKRNRRSFEITRKEAETAKQPGIEFYQNEYVSIQFRFFVFLPNNPIHLRAKKDDDVFEELKFNLETSANPYGLSK